MIEQIVQLVQSDRVEEVLEGLEVLNLSRDYSLEEKVAILKQYGFKEPKP